MSHNYSKTLNLPKTEFAMKAGLAQKEPRMLKQWEENGLYAKLREQSAGKPTYTLHDGPPYANGHIHIGHALNKILKDFIVKMKTMQGCDSLYVPGWDCHGLPIEHQLFKKLKKKKSEVDSLEFRKQAHEYALNFVAIQREEFKRLGIFGEWENPYLTLTPGYEYWILKSFLELTKKGYVYRGLKPVNWCATCETALAEAEVEYEDHTSPSVFVKLKTNNPEVIKGLPNDKPLFLLIWTTTPWTLLANVAVAAHPNFTYVFVDTGKDVIVMEKSLHSSVLERAGINDFKVVKEIPGNELCQLTYTHPFDIKDDCRVIVMDYVTKEDGTGLVHTAPGHGQEDFEAGAAHKLDVLMPVNDRGIFTNEAGIFEGQHVFKANLNIIEELKKRETLLLSADIAHSYPHCWRCKKPIIFRATKQWFMKIDHNDLRRQMKEHIQKDIQWFPESGEERISGMAETRPDWCLSRQRHWGVPIPALSCKGCNGEHKLFPEVIEYFAEKVKDQGTDAWFACGVDELVPQGFVCPDCGGKDFKKTYDILDVWFDSGVSHQAVVGPMLDQKLPVDLYLEGSDQHRGWFQSSLILSVALDGRPPYRAVLTHGFVVDGQGRKMSKSMGNVISPQDVIKNNGVDILRLWVASSNYNEDIRLSKEILDRLIDAYRKIRNTVRFLLGNLEGFDPDRDMLAYEELLDIDKWALSRLGNITAAVKQSYNNFEFAKVYKVLYSFCNEDLSSFYLDILKDRLYTSHTSSQERRSAQTVLFQILNHVVRLMAPIMVFTADEVFAAMPKTSAMQGVDNVHCLEWLDVPAEWQDAQIDKKFELLIALRPHILRALEDARTKGEIGSSLEAKICFQTASQRDLQYLENFGDLLPAIFIVSQVAIEQVQGVEKGLSEIFSQTIVQISKAAGEKCSRCWNYFVDLGSDPEHPLLCKRCTGVVKKLEREGVVNFSQFRKV